MRLRVFALCLLVASPLSAREFRHEVAKKALMPDGLCYSTTEYIKMIKFFRELKEVRIPENDIRNVADDVSKGCDGSADRFIQTFQLLKKMGVAYQKVLLLSLEFSKVKPEVQENFFEVLKLTYLKEVFDFDFNMALDVAYDFSMKLDSHHEQAREDFSDLAAFCTKSKELKLPIRTCSEVAIQIAHFSPYFPEGVFQPFLDLHDKLRKDEKLGLSIKQTLQVTVEVLKNGPRAPENFITGYDYAVQKEGLALEASKALKFALRMAQRSSAEFPPPKTVIQKTETTLE